MKFLCKNDGVHNKGNMLKIEKYGLKFYVCYTPDHITCRNMQYLQNWKFFAEINLLMLDFVTWCRWQKNKVLVTYSNIIISKIMSGWAAEILFLKSDRQVMQNVVISGDELSGFYCIYVYVHDIFLLCQNVCHNFSLYLF